jgi:hypothetical protein
MQFTLDSAGPGGAPLYRGYNASSTHCLLYLALIDYETAWINAHQFIKREQNFAGHSYNQRDTVADPGGTPAGILSVLPEDAAG